MKSASILLSLKPGGLSICAKLTDTKLGRKLKSKIEKKSKKAFVTAGYST